MKNRNKQRENKARAKFEERLESKTEWGISDPTPKQAVDNIINKYRASV